MNLDSIREEFNSAFQAKEVVKLKLPPDAPCYYKHSFYPLHCLTELRDEVQRFAAGDKIYAVENDDFLANYAVRFVVDRDGVIKFTREGPRSSTVPAHSDYATSVLSAGNVIFSEDYSRIVKITNKSGHFKPSFATLVFALALILESGFPLAEEIILENDANQDHGSFSLEELRTLIPTDFDLREAIDINSSRDVFIDTNEPDSTVIIAPAPVGLHSMFSNKSSAQVRKLAIIDFSYDSPDECYHFSKVPKR